MFISSNYVYHSIKKENKDKINPISSVSLNLNMNNRPKERNFKNTDTKKTNFKDILDKEIGK